MNPSAVWIDCASWELDFFGLPHHIPWPSDVDAATASKEPFEVEHLIRAIDIVTDEEILRAQAWLASHEGIFVEPASAAGIAGIFKSLDPQRAHERRLPHIPDGSRIVCTVTGHGLKDPDVAKEQCGSVIPAKADKSEIVRLLSK